MSPFPRRPATRRAAAGGWRAIRPAGGTLTSPGYRLFSEELARFSAEAAEPRLTAIAQRIAAPLRVAVLGRRGVGRSTVGHALAAQGLALTAPAAIPDAHDVVVYVIAEVVKPEDRTAIAAAGGPVLVVLSKADLTGSPEPMAAARRRCAQFTELTGAPAEAMVALLAVAALDGLLDEALWAALEQLASQPADTRSPDAFLAVQHPLPIAMRRRLLETLDLFGIVLVVAAIQRATPEAAIVALLRRASGIDTVVGKVATFGFEARYRRVLGAVAELETLAVTDDRVRDFLCRDATVIARMAAAVDVVEATGLEVDPGDDPDVHLRRAVHWQHYSRGPVPTVHRTCGADIVRGSLRLWSERRS